MRTQLLVLGIALTASASTASPTMAAQDDIFLKCSIALGGRNVIPPEKFAALADNLSDPAFAKFDPDCKGKAANPAGVAASKKGQQQEARRIVNDLRTVVSNRRDASGVSSAGVPAEVARKDFGQDKPLTLPVLFRDAYSWYSLLSPPPPKERANGTQISYTQDYLSRNNIISGKGAVIGWDVLSVGADQGNPLAGTGVTRMLWAPGFEFDQTRNHVNPKLNIDYLALKLIGELEKESAPDSLFPLQYFRYGGYWKTDSRGGTSIAGAFGEWEPYKLEWAIGVAPRIFGGPMQFRWSPILRVETEKVMDAGPLTNLHTGDLYSRGGPIVRADVFFAEGLLKNLVLGAQYRHFWSFDRGDRDKEIRYFQADASYNLDDAGIFALSATYRDGMLPGNGVRVREIKTGLTIKN